MQRVCFGDCLVSRGERECERVSLCVSVSVTEREAFCGAMYELFGARVCENPNIVGLSYYLHFLKGTIQQNDQISHHGRMIELARFHNFCLIMF